jgi:hypothetical protein
MSIGHWVKISGGAAKCAFYRLPLPLQIRRSPPSLSLQLNAVSRKFLQMHVFT